MLSGSFTFFVWCTMMLALFLSLFAIFFVQGAATLLEGGNVDDEMRESIVAYFGTVGSGMLSLFMAATGGNDWVEFYDVLVACGTLYALLFQFFIAFSVIAFFNVIS